MGSNTCTAPYHPVSNGAAEQLVQSVKQELWSAHTTGVPLEQTVMTFQLKYRTTPHATTGMAPCELLMDLKLRTQLDLLMPDVELESDTNRSNKRNITIFTLSRGSLSQAKWYHQ